MMELHEFMLQSPTGKTHAVNPKTKKTYCGRDPDSPGWRFLDVIPSDKHKPTCSTCVLHYDEPLIDELSQIAKAVRGTINEFLCSIVLLKDTEALGRFTANIKTFMQNERKIREGKNEVPHGTKRLP